MNGSALTPFAWSFMLTSMLSVTMLVVYCYKRILFDDRQEPEEEIRAPSPDAPAGG
jgi:hypothetical protein